MNDADIDIGQNDAIFSNLLRQMTASNGTTEAVTVESGSSRSGTNQPDRTPQGTPPNHAPDEAEEARLHADRRVQ